MLKLMPKLIKIQRSEKFLEMNFFQEIFANFKIFCRLWEIKFESIWTKIFKKLKIRYLKECEISSDSVSHMRLWKDEICIERSKRAYILRQRRLKASKPKLLDQIRTVPLDSMH